MFRKIAISIIFITALILTFHSNQVQTAKDYILKNILLWSQMEEDKLPIYCVDMKKKEIALTFDTAWGNEDMKDV